MKTILLVVILIIVIGLLGGVGYFVFQGNMTTVLPQKEADKPDSSVKVIDFSQINPDFLFSAQIPKEFEVEYVQKLRAINVYDPLQEGSSNIEKSQFYITFFRANTFLTLSTVNITRKDAVTVKGRDAILYEITKKDSVPNFAGQPSWRNVTHLALDVRFSQDNPTYFYSFAYHPSIPKVLSDNFANSLIFYTQN